MSYIIKEILTNNDINVRVLHYYNQSVAPLDLSVFSKDELAKFEKYKSDKRKLEFYYSRVLWQNFNVDLPIKYKPSGKPIISHGFISVSHSHNKVAIAYSKSNEVGVDIEMISEKINKVKHKFLHPKDNYKNLKDLTQLWTIKEAVYKLFDGNNIYFMDNIFVTKINKSTIAKVDFPKYNLKAITQSFKLNADFFVTLAFEK